MRSVYIHIPFCNNICSYCDFCKILNYERYQRPYLDSLFIEINQYYERDNVRTIYIGGGTPSSLSKNNLIYLFKIINIFDKRALEEFTFECNINDINEELLTILKENGVNRLSIGVESFNKINLKFLNRKHNKKDIKNKIKLCREFGFNNINVDLIYALPTENMWVLRRDIKSLLKLKVEHISTYSLIIEKNTILYNNNIKNIDEELDAKMYKYICRKLKKKKYIHYELSNFSFKGYESKHNLTYWDNNEYYGFGAGASGYVNQMRYENTRSITAYIKHKYRINECLVSTQEEMENEVILGLRKLKGVSIKDFYKKFDMDIHDVFKIDDGEKQGFLKEEKGYIFIPEDKIYIMNEIINMIM